MLPKPENIGDIYRAVGYPATGMIAYGWAYPDDCTQRAGHWCWWLEMSDGDCYEWDEAPDGPDVMGATLELVRRNPLPDDDYHTAPRAATA